jgi:hypothetical protein
MVEAKKEKERKKRNGASQTRHSPEESLEGTSGTLAPQVTFLLLFL